MEFKIKNKIDPPRKELRKPVLPVLFELNRAKTIKQLTRSSELSHGANEGEIS